MFFVFLSDIKKKLFVFTVVFSVWLGITHITGLIISMYSFSLASIGSCLESLYAENLQVEKIYINEKLDSEEYLPVFSNTAINPTVQKFSDYNTVRNSFSFKFPDTFETSPKDLSGSEILYHMDFKDKSSPAHGFVQVWDLPGSLGSFLDSSKQNSTMSFLTFKQSEINVNGNAGYLWDYTFLSGSGEDYTGKEVFLKQRDIMFRIGYFVPSDNWDSKHEETFRNIINSIK